MKFIRHDELVPQNVITIGFSEPVRNCYLLDLVVDGDHNPAALESAGWAKNFLGDWEIEVDSWEAVQEIVSKTDAIGELYTLDVNFARKMGIDTSKRK